MAGTTMARIRIVIPALAAVLVLAVAAALAIGLRRGRGPDGAGPGGGDAAGPAAPTAAPRAGGLEAAFARFARPGAAEPGADDLHAVGAALLSRGRLVLGWTAMEAAHQVDRRHPATARALEELEGDLNRAGPVRAARQEAADCVEQLRSVRGGPALGLLAMGLARYADTPGRERDFLDRLLIRDRAALRAVDGPGGAVKLVARLLMETGRPAEASDLLRPRVESAATDREAAWLLSRAALQLGQAEAADAMLGRAAGFGRDGASPEPSPFVGARKCAECHRIAYRKAQRESPHARTIALGAGLKDVPLPDGPFPDPLEPRIRHTFTRESADRIRLETRDDRGRVVRAVVAYALGSGEHGITMVTRDDPAGTPRQLRISYYAPDRSWRATKGVDAGPHGPEEFLGQALSGKALRQCLHCHTTWFRDALPDPSMPAGPEALDRGIGCERCHGPGLNHIKAVEVGYAEPAIAVTGDAPPRRLLASCEECHASNGLVEPSDPEFTRVQGTTLKFSRCFTASRGAIHCATCHDPHSGLDTTASHYEPKCLNCHAAPTSAGPGRPGPGACPVNPASGCIGCHMPKVQDPGFRTRFTDHHIRVHRATARDGRGPTTDDRR